MSDEHVARIDVSRLPEDLVALIDRLGTGDRLLIARDGDVIATISSTTASIEDDAGPVPADEAVCEPAMDFGDVLVVATAMKLSASARASLSAQLGPDYIVLDMHAAPRTADVLLVPPVSPQLIASLRTVYPKARVVVAEIEDRELGITYQGPVRRMLDAGAQTYLMSTTIPRLAEQLDHAITQSQQLSLGNTARLEIEAERDPRVNSKNHTDRPFA
ncbi:hypothetical protein BKA25_002548 [Actinoalloteichus hymeniacidonis]|uniref:Uncharacterized protein n=1 Tax=Actinoalloteichus hymeniacidonis TaxID=340345 RepID=A0AAC9HQT2_9PSEU|nr:hypothetical protein [Actinoalloteichus hymeniacidonis]AOS63715.1 hypothetical protein TL08_14510 [Actinoalloteichus hymeniacidonis]MBB5908232.1 hypothetical protein [Actinoalloteichus hymeniacidonis]